MALTTWHQMAAAAVLPPQAPPGVGHAGDGPGEAAQVQSRAGDVGLLARLAGARWWSGGARPWRGAMRHAPLLVCVLVFADVLSAQERPTIESVVPAPVVGSNGAQWLTVRGTGFSREFNARIRTEGIDAAVSDPRSLEFRTSEEVAVLKVFGNEASWWTVEVSVPGAPPSEAFAFRVVPPPPVIESVALAGAEPGESGYTLTVTGPDLTNYTEVLVDGRTVEAEPIRTSQYISALTVGYKAKLSDSAFDPFRQHTVRLFTPGDGGGYSGTELLPALPVPFRARWSTWAFAAGLLLAIAGMAYAFGRRGGRGVPESEAAQQVREIARLEREVARAEARERAQARIVADVVHDARTHLQLVLDPLRRGRASWARTAERGALRLQGLLDQLLDHARIGAGELRLQTRRVDLVQTVRQVVSTFKERAEGRGISLQYRAPGGAVVLGYDAERMARAIENLVANALKYTPAGGEVVVSVEGEGGRGLVRVADTGVGMSSDLVQRVYERGVQGDEGRAGAGLGLSLTRGIVEAHGGEVLIDSTLGLGTTVSVSFPSGEGPVVTTSPMVSSDDGLPQESWPGGEEADPEGSPDPPSDLHGRRVLVVDDDDDLREYLLSELSGTFATAGATDGLTAFETAVAWKPDVVVTDVAMPRADGLALIEELRATESTREVVILMMTGRGGEVDAGTGLSLGADDYVPKPFAVDELRARIEGHLRRRDTYRGEVRVPDGRVLSSMHEAFVERAYEVALESMADRRFNVAALAAALGYSPGHLRKRFADVFGEPPSEWLTRVRLERGRELLEADVGLVKEIADAVGYSPDRFTERFREAYGVPPSEWPPQNGHTPGPDR